MHHARHVHRVFFLQHLAVHLLVSRLQLVVQFLVQPVGDFFLDVGGEERAVVFFEHAHDQFQLLQVGFDRRHHVGVLQLAGEFFAFQTDGAMHLPQRGGRSGLLLEAFEFLFPVRAQFRDHAAADEEPAHGRRLVLQFLQLGRVFLG